MTRVEHLVRGRPSFKLTQEEVIFCITIVLIGAFSLFLPKFLTAGNILTLSIILAALIEGIVFFSIFLVK